MEEKNMNLIEITLNEHKKMLEQLGYKVDLTVKDIINYRRVEIFKNDIVIGDIAFENKNMFYLYRDNRIVGNRDLSKINFNKRKIKNTRSMIHLRLHDYDLRFNGYNQLISEERPFIAITDNETYKVTKNISDDKIEIKSLKEDISDDEILGYLRKTNKKLTYNIKGV